MAQFRKTGGDYTNTITLYVPRNDITVRALLKTVPANRYQPSKNGELIGKPITINTDLMRDLKKGGYKFKFVPGTRKQGLTSVCGYPVHIGTKNPNHIDVRIEGNDTITCTKIWMMISEHLKALYFKATGKDIKILKKESQRVPACNSENGCTISEMVI